MDWVLMMVLYVVVPVGAILVCVVIWRANSRDRSYGPRPQDDIEWLAAWARRIGLKFRASRNGAIRYRFPLLKCLHGGDGCFAYNIMEGTVGKRTVCAFDYHYDNGSEGLIPSKEGINAYWEFSALIVESRLVLKPLFIRPEGFFDKVTEFAGLDDIDFESAEFSQKFRVKSQDRRWAYDVMHQKTIELMLNYPHFAFDLQGSQIMAYGIGRTFSTGDFAAALDVVMGILDNLPDSVVQQAKRAGAESGQS